MREALILAAERWVAIQASELAEHGAPRPYRLSLAGHIGFAAFDFSVVVRDDVPTLESGQPWVDSELPTLEKLFGMIESHRGSGTGRPTRSPRSIAVPGSIDDEAGLFIRLDRLD